MTGPGGVTGPGGLVLGGGGCLVETPPDGHCCGRYASYWNAFLLHINSKLLPYNCKEEVHKVIEDTILICFNS